MRMVYFSISRSGKGMNNQVRENWLSRLTAVFLFIPNQIDCMIHNWCVIEIAYLPGCAKFFIQLNPGLSLDKTILGTNRFSNSIL